MTKSKTVKFWRMKPGVQRDKLVDFYRAIKSRESYATGRPGRWRANPIPLDPRAKILKVHELAKELIDDYDTEPAQLKTMLESAGWAPENIETVLCQKP